MTRPTRWTGLLLGALTCFCVATAGAVEYEETYYGQRIRILTTREADDAWRARAELQEGQELAVGVHPSEEAARSAVLSAAMAELDRRRAWTGKP